MPALASSRRSAVTPKKRGGLTQRQRVLSELSTMSEPPRKRQKFRAGGTSRFQDPDGLETPGSGTGAESAHTSRREGRSLRNIASTRNTTPYGRPDRPRRERRAPQQEPVTRPRYSSAAAAAAAVVQGDGFKPREERGWEEFHEHLDIDVRLPVFSSGLVDGTIRLNEEDDVDSSAEHENNEQQDSLDPSSPRKRRAQRSQSAMLRGIGTLDAQKAAVPIPGPNPREKLTLPRPSFKNVDPFISYEKANGSIDYVDKAMANVGYQESDHFDRPERGLVRLNEDNLDEELEPAAGSTSESATETLIPRVEYDMDEQDQKWLEAYNAWRKTEGVEPIRPATFEITMTKIEKEWHALEKRIPKPNPKPPQTHRPRSSSAAAVNGEPVPDGEEQDTKCAICDDGDCENTNAIVFCDGCDLAVHQECYGVPFIPEGQWLCRKCHLIGSGTPTCVFCPNTDGAFKQTNSARWAHLLCAIWIPEVSLGNTTFMEPVMDVEKVPKSRWRLTCDICKQKMGACIQCSHKACYTAFHPTCARRARWFVSMKSGHGGSAILDSSMLRAYCGLHVTEEWAQTYSTDRATRAARKYYKKAMREKIWADPHQANPHLPVAFTPPPPSVALSDDNGSKLTLSFKGAQKKKPNSPAKPTWKLNTGAPVIPSVLFNTVDGSLIKFALRKRREFAADMCKYWTLKREAKRGAALIKRLQLQMETFSSMEITRRNFAGMGAIGGARLKRRIDFAKERISEIGQLTELCCLMKDRESQKLQEAEILREMVDTTYFPIPPLLWQVLEKAQHHDSKDTFKEGLLTIKERLQQRAYASVAPITADLGLAFARVMAQQSDDAAQALSGVQDDTTAKKVISADDKGKRAIAKRILKAIHPTIEAALQKESELNKLPVEKSMLDLDQLLAASLPPQRVTEVVSNDNSAIQDASTMDIESVANAEKADAAEAAVEQDKNGDPQGHPTPVSTDAAQLDDVDVQAVVDQDTLEDSSRQVQQAPTPPLSTNSSHLQAGPSHIADRATPLKLGGVPWYMESFDPSGLTLHAEIWTGRDAQGSEELSDAEDVDMPDEPTADLEEQLKEAAEHVAEASPRRGGAARGRGRGNGRARGKRGKGRWAK